MTYPYIMAKVRIQTRTVDLETAEEEHVPPPPPGYHHKGTKHAGALDILIRVWRHHGFLGWYQVRHSSPISPSALYSRRALLHRAWVHRSPKPCFHRLCSSCRRRSLSTGRSRSCFCSISSDGRRPHDFRMCPYCFDVRRLPWHTVYCIAY